MQRGVRGDLYGTPSHHPIPMSCHVWLNGCRLWHRNRLEKYFNNTRIFKWPIFGGSAGVDYAVVWGMIFQNRQLELSVFLGTSGWGGTPISSRKYGRGAGWTFCGYVSAGEMWCWKEAIAVKSVHGWESIKSRLDRGLAWSSPWRHRCCFSYVVYLPYV